MKTKEITAKNFMESFFDDCINDEVIEKMVKDESKEKMDKALAILKKVK
ncbi:hypothetical protein [Poseidonibacter ostreae]|nr:hypothetical protein [Poseidonibacter ostreae]